MLQSNVIWFKSYHCCGMIDGLELMIMGDGAVPPAVGTVDTGATASGAIVRFADPIEVRMFVPFPSFASTEPERNASGALPLFFASNRIVMTFPLFPWNPGFGDTPPKSIVPSWFENVGFCTHKLRTEFDCDIESTSSWFVGNDTSPCTAFIAWSGDDTSTETLKLRPAK